MLAHDGWVETNTNLIRTGDAVYVDLFLGNHGNDHRDFKVAGKIDVQSSTLVVIAPDGKEYDLRPDLVDVGYAPKEGFWTAKFAAAKPGLYLVGHMRDEVMSYAPVRVLQSAKAAFVVSDRLDAVASDQPGFDRVLGHPLELVAVSNPVTPMGPGEEIRVRLLLAGKPLSGAKVSFVPRGVALREGFDERYERATDAEGIATFTPASGNVYLIVAHHEEGAGGDGYERTKYSAAFAVFVPDVCPCCGE